MTASCAAEHHYSYDAFGDPSMDASSPRKYDGNNRIESSSRVAYDAAGDMTRDGKHRYEYDAERRISQVDGGAAEYLYSAEGDRIEKRVGDASTETIWVGNDPIAELKPDGTWVDYLYLDGRRVAAIGRSDATYYVADPLGMTRMELSATGDILAQSDMTPFGQLINRHSDADEVPFTGGEQYDAESGLYSYKYRSYNPQLGRWMSPDPSDEEFARVSNPQSLNLYSYVINDPLKYVDQLGLVTCPSNSTQVYEAADELQVQKNLQKLPTAPSSARMVLTGCVSQVCQYSLTGLSGTYYVYEHFANNGVSGSKQVGPNDFTTDKTGTYMAYPDDQIVGISATLDECRYFTISTNPSYDPNNQMSVMIFEKGGNVSYEHLYGTAGGGASWINGISTAYYKP